MPVRRLDKQIMIQHTVEYYIAVKKNVAALGTTWKAFQKTLLSENSKELS